MNTKFVNQLVGSHKDIRTERAIQLSDQVRLEQETLVNDLKRRLFSSNADLSRLFDLAPSSTVDLTVGGKNFDASDWARRVQDHKVAILNLKAELVLATETLNEWFTVGEAQTATNDA